MTQINTASIADLTGIGGAVIGDLELKIIRLEDELELTEKRYQNERQYAQAQRSNAQSWQRMIDGANSATDALELVRNILDETYPQDDDENMGRLRKMLKNESDTEKQIDADGYDRDEVEPIPF